MEIKCADNKKNNNNSLHVYSSQLLVFAIGP